VRAEGFIYRIFSILGSLEAPGPLLVHFGAGSNTIFTQFKQEINKRIRCIVSNAKDNGKNGKYG